jgi:NAD(P)-dependent dehydrogenase (short-subunit alcohol dehydrogenase family)
MTPPHRRTALVTGGARGIGRALCARFLRDGWNVAAMDVDTRSGTAAARALAGLGPLRFVAGDVADEAQVRDCIGEAVRSFGALHAVVNNAGIAEPDQGPPEALEVAQWNRMIAVNLTGAFVVAKHAIPHLRAARGAIVNIASTRALQSEPHTEAYAASKGGLVALTHALAMSLGPEIRVNCISPGWIDVSGWRESVPGEMSGLRPEDHAQHPVGRVGVPDDVGALVLHLVSDAAGFITGQNFVVDGGMTRKTLYVS